MYIGVRKLFFLNSIDPGQTVEKHSLVWFWVFTLGVMLFIK